MKNFIIGPVMIPGFKIKKGPNVRFPFEHYVVFEADTIYALREKFHRNKFDNKVSINHDGKEISGVYLEESYILNKVNRPQLPHELQDLPNGTWIVGYKVENLEVQKLIESKQIRGFSAEGCFEYELREA